MFRRIFPLLFAVSLTACSTFTDQELARFRAQRVSPPVYTKLSRGEPLGPTDVIELRRRGVADVLIIRQIEDHGVTSLIGRSDVTTLRKAGVSAAVIDALLRASDDFAGDYAAREYGVAVGSYWPGFSYYDPWPWYGGVGVGFSTGRYYYGRPGHRRYHRHH